MTWTYEPFDAGSGANVTESGWTAMMRLHRTSGVVPGDLNGLNVFADASGMQVRVDTGRVWIEGHWGENDAIVTLAVNAAHATLARIDRIVARVDWSANTIAAVYVAGTASGSPTPPALLTSGTQWDVPLAQVYISAASSNIQAWQVHDERAYTAPRGLAAPQNQLVNGGQELWTKATSIAASGYAADSWRLEVGTGGTAGVTRVGGLDTNSSFAAQVALSVFGSSTSFYRQYLEAPISWGGQTLSFSARVQTSTFTAVRAFIDTNAGRTYSTYVLGIGVSMTVVVPNFLVPANATFVSVGFQFDTAATLIVDNCMLVFGPVWQAYTPLHPASDTERAQRYVEKLPTVRAWGNVGTATRVVVSIPFNVQKYITPTLTFSSSTTTGLTGSLASLGIGAEGFALDLNTVNGTYQITTDVLAESPIV